MEDGKSITEDEHTEFYRFVTGQYDKPRYTLQYKIDVPINLRALIYIPQYKPSLLKDDLSKKKLFNFELDIFDVTQEAEVGVALYSRKVLIQSKANQLLPRWLRFVKGNSSFSVIQKTLFILGVVDSEDIPLNLSRELLQDSNLIRLVSFYENP
jgi:TNF receptor-associated protein 1